MWGIKDKEGNFNTLITVLLLVAALVAGVKFAAGGKSGEITYEIRLISDMVFSPQHIQVGTEGGTGLYNELEASKRSWVVGHGKYKIKKDAYEFPILLQGKEIAKATVEAKGMSLSEARENLVQSLDKMVIGPLKKKKNGFEIPLLLKGREIAKVRANKEGVIISKSPWKKVKGGSAIGLFLGVIGTLMMGISQLYSFRKKQWLRKGRIKTWLSAHALLGILGFGIILTHAGFPFEFKYTEVFKEGLAGLSTWLAIIVVVSGFIGRYLYKRMDERGRRLFRHWRTAHIPLVNLFFLAMLVHIVKYLMKD